MLTVLQFEQSRRAKDDDLGADHRRKWPFGLVRPIQDQNEQTDLVFSSLLTNTFSAYHAETFPIFLLRINASLL